MGDPLRNPSSKDASIAVALYERDLANVLTKSAPICIMIWSILFLEIFRSGMWRIFLG
jgi:hypothetical protein